MLWVYLISLVTHYDSKHRYARLECQRTQPHGEEVRSLGKDEVFEFERCQADIIRFIFLFKFNSSEILGMD
eukprot:1333891-Amorphochlora_amoeboformis.AAC.2